MKKICSVVLCFIVVNFVFAVYALNSEAVCPPEELPEIFTQRVDIGGIMVLAVNEAQEHHINHLKYVYNRLLIRDDKVEGRIREYIRRENITIILLEDFDEMREIQSLHGEEPDFMRNCNHRILNLEQVNYLGGDADEYELWDDSITDILEIVLYHGVRKAYPDWTRRLKKAMGRAVSAGLFNGFKADDELHKRLWHFAYGSIGIQVYYNLWTKEQTVLDGAYPFVTKDALQKGDPNLYNLIEEIFPTGLYQ